MNIKNLEYLDQNKKYDWNVGYDVLFVYHVVLTGSEGHSTSVSLTAESHQVFL